MYNIDNFYQNQNNSGIPNPYLERAQLYNLQRQADVCAAASLMQIKAARAAELEEIRVDIRERKGLLADEIKVDSAGNLVRRKEFLTVLPQRYEICNFYLPEAPRLFENLKDPKVKILCFQAGKEDGSLVKVYINLQETDSNYFRRQLRNAGLKLKIRSRQVSEFIPLLLEALLERAVPASLPTKRGFYLDSEGAVKYAGRDALLWKEAVEYAG